MNPRPILILAMLGAVLGPDSPGSLFAQESGVAKAAAPSGPSQELDALVTSINEKIEKGQKDEAAYADEFGKFDALLAKYSSQKTDEVADILAAKVTLYLEVFQDYGNALSSLKQLKADFPATQDGKRADALIDQLKQQMEAAKASDALKPGAVFPSFAEKDLQGNPLNLESFRGHFVLVDFWATWCGPCVKEFPDVLAAYQKYHARGFDIVGISLDEDRAALDAFIKDHSVTWPQYFDGNGWQNKLARQYGVVAIPSTYLLDRQGKILAVGHSGPELNATLDALLGK
jgi:peroxiredoxin